MIRTLAICVALMLVSAAAYAALPITQTIVMQDSFDTYGRVAGANLADGAVWGGDATNGEFTIYDDGGNLCVKAVPRSMGTGNRTAWAGGPHGNYGALMQTYDINRLHFEAKDLTTGTTRWDKNNLVTFTNSTAYAYGSEYGMGFAVLTDGARPALGLGSNPLNPPANGWVGTQVSVETTWHSYDMVWNRLTNMVEWYKDSTLLESKDCSAYQWAIGFTGTTPVQRWMKSFTFVSCGKDAANPAGSWLYDNVYMAGANVPEPSSLIALSALGLGALGFIRRRKA